jgi:hypothetical protein
MGVELAGVGHSVGSAAIRGVLLGVMAGGACGVGVAASTAGRGGATESAASEYSPGKVGMATPRIHILTPTTAAQAPVATIGLDALIPGIRVLMLPTFAANRPMARASSPAAS